MIDTMLDIVLVAMLAAVSGMGFAFGANPTRRMILVSGVLATLGYITRLALLASGVGLATSTLCAALTISLLSIPCSHHWHTPAEMFTIPALIPMVPGLYAYRTILGFMQFLENVSPAQRQAYLVDIIFNGVTTFFVMWALVIGATLPLFFFHRNSPVRRRLPWSNTRQQL